MDLLASPSALIGLIGCIGLAGWSMGRWQGLTAHAQAADDLLETHRGPQARAITPDPPAFTGLQTPTANAGLRENAITLSDMHAEITRFRHREQVLATLKTEAAIFDQRASGQLEVCRTLGALGSLHFKELVVEDVSCRCLQVSGDPVVAQPTMTSPAAVSMAQPSPGASPLTRV
jgi:hypothetical protein